MRKTRMSFLVPAMLAGALMLFAADISTDYDHHADFAKYHTYSWLGVRAGNSLWQNRITSAVDQALQSKGWQKVPSGGDAVVSAFGRTTEQDTLETYYDGFPGWGWRGWGGMGMATTETIPQRVGNLTVDIFDGNTKQLVFRGQAADAISSNKPEKNEHKMDEAVDKMFKHFPPNGKG
jgi:hypothetical protein